MRNRIHVLKSDSNCPSSFTYFEMNRVQGDLDPYLLSNKTTFQINFLMLSIGWQRVHK